MTCEQNKLLHEINILSFTVVELTLFLDTHPTNKKAMELLCEYRKIREELVKVYENRFGPYVVISDDVKPDGCWEWLKGPWPWENGFMEG